MLLIFVSYFILRIINLTNLPIFNDEAIYLYWGQEEIRSIKMLFFSLYDAKPPLLMWLFGLSSQIFSNPLFAGRIIAVLFGFIATIGIYYIGKTIFNKQTAKLAALLYIINPLFSFFDRLALMESAVSAVGVWLLYFSIKLNKDKIHQLHNVLILGTLLALGAWIKINALIFTFPLVGIFIYQIFQHWRIHRSLNKKHLFDLLKIIIISQVLLLPLYLQNLFWHTLPTNSRFSLTFLELLGFPISHWLTNFKDMIEILFWQISPIAFITAVIGLFYLIKLRIKNRLIFVLWLLVPFTILIFTARSLTPRYVVSFVPLLLLPTAYTLTNVWGKKKIFGYLLCLFVCGIQIYITGLQLFSPLSYFNLLDKFTRFSQKQEYVTDWTAGYGIPETITYLYKQSEKQPIIVGVRIDAGNPESAMHAYFYRSNKIRIIFMDTKSFAASGFNCIKFSQPFFFVARDVILDGIKLSLEEKIRFYKPESHHFVSIHIPKKNCVGKTVYFQ